LSAPRRQEHEVADAYRYQALFDAIPAQEDRLAALAGRHVVAISDFSAELLLQIFRRAAHFEQGGGYAEQPLLGREMVMAFLDNPHSPTKLSFAAAWSRLGGASIEMGEMFSRVESEVGAVSELAEMCNNYGDLAVVRTQKIGSMDEMLAYARIPVINAGDGDEETPPHAMADLYTLFKWRPALIGPADGRGPPLTVAVAGWPARSRTLCSFLRGLALFPDAVEQVICFGRNAPMFSPGQREELETAGLTVRTGMELHPAYMPLDCIKRLLPITDLLFVDSGHLELSRQGAMEAMSILKPGAMLLHPNLLSEEYRDFFYDTPHNAYFAQTRAAVFVRMALLEGVSRDEGTEHRL
jgi:aspartate carbamoyltransferase catalytic subunit